LPVGPAHVETARAIAERLGLRSRIDESGTLSKRILTAHHEGVPFVAVIGDREVSDGTLSVRAGDHQWSGRADQVITELRDRCMQPA
jgi:threonyl-tRNA synthetase